MRSASLCSVSNHWTCVSRCSVISWFVYSQCATRGYSLLSSRLSVCPWAAALLLRNLGALALAAAKPQFSLFVFLLAHAPQLSGHLSLSGVRSGRVGPGCPGLTTLAHACPWPDTDTLRRIRAAGQKTLPLTTLGHNLHSTGGRRRQSPDVGRALDSAPGLCRLHWRRSQVTCPESESRLDDKLT